MKPGGVGGSGFTGLILRWIWSWNFGILCPMVLVSIQILYPQLFKGEMATGPLGDRCGE